MSISTPRIRKGFKLSSIIAFIVLSTVLLTIVIITTVSYFGEKHSLTKTTLDMNLLNANQISQTTQMIIQSMEDSVRVTAQFLKDVPLSNQIVQEHLDYIMSTSQYLNAIEIVNYAGDTIAASPQSTGFVGHKAMSEAERYALTTQQPYISGPYVSNANRKIIMISYPIFDLQQQYAGFVAGEFNLDQPNFFSEILSSHDINLNGSFNYIVDSTGKLIYHPDTKRINEDVSHNEVVQQMIQGNTYGSQEVRSTQGVNYLAGYSKVEGVGWGIVSQTPVTNIQITTLQLIQNALLVSMPYLLVLSILSIWFARKLALPINRIATYASKLYDRNQQIEMIPIYKDWNYETNELSKALSMAIDRIKEHTEALSEEAHTDALTGVANRRAMEGLISLWEKQGISYALVLMDLDRFKLINDTYGHKQGDEVLKFFAQIMMEEKREQDVRCRFGGEEFVILFPMSDIQAAYDVAEKVRRRMEREISPIGRPVTVSAGVTSTEVIHKEVKTLLEAADEALYEAKETGRNRTVIYKQVES